MSDIETALETLRDAAKAQRQLLSALADYMAWRMEPDDPDPGEEAPASDRKSKVQAIGRDAA